MRKILILTALFTVLLFGTSVQAEGFLPRYSDSINYYGIGVYFAPKNIEIYSNPDLKGSMVEQIYWDQLGVTTSDDELSSKTTFLAFLPEKHIALLSVVDETDNAFQVVYNQNTGAKGWIKADEDKYMPWGKFITKYGRENGLYLLSDLPAQYKKIHTAPDENAQVEGNEGYSFDKIQLKYLSGNWILIKAPDFSGTDTHIGWIKWRNDEGKIFAFPNLDRD